MRSVCDAEPSTLWRWLKRLLHSGGSAGWRRPVRGRIPCAMSWIVARRCLLALGIIALVAVGLSLDLGEVMRAFSGFAAWIHDHGALGVAAFAGAFVAWSLVL